MSSETDTDELRREFRIEVDQLRRELRTLRQAITEQQAINLHQKAEIDELYRWAGDTTTSARHVAKLVRALSPALEDAAKDSAELRTRLNKHDDVTLNAFMYLEDLCYHLYERVFPKAASAITRIHDILGRPSFDSPLALDFKKRPAP